MKTRDYRRLIVEGMKGLPDEALAEIAGYVYFVRKRIMEPHAFEAELYNASLWAAKERLSRNEEVHLEEEFEGYDELYPVK